MILPSASCAVIMSSDTSTALILASVLTTVLMPRLQDLGQVLVNIHPNLRELPRGEPVVLRERYRLEPELAHHSLTTSVNVRGFVAVEAVEIEAIRPRDALDCWHSGLGEDSTTHCSPLVRC